MTVFDARLGFHDGPVASAEMLELYGVAVSPTAIYVADRKAHRIRRLWR